MAKGTINKSDERETPRFIKLMYNEGKGGEKWMLLSQSNMNR